MSCGKVSRAGTHSSGIRATASVTCSINSAVENHESYRNHNDPRPAADTMAFESSTSNSRGCRLAIVARLHDELREASKSRPQPEAETYDQAVTALIEDIYERGLDKRVLVVVTGEFGRTPKIIYAASTGGGNASAPAGTQQPGRDHWPPRGPSRMNRSFY